MLPTAGCRLLAAGCWLLAADYLALVARCMPRRSLVSIFRGSFLQKIDRERAFRCTPIPISTATTTIMHLKTCIVGALILATGMYGRQMFDACYPERKYESFLADQIVVLEGLKQYQGPGWTTDKLRPVAQIVADPAYRRHQEMLKKRTEQIEAFSPFAMALGAFLVFIGLLSSSNPRSASATYRPLRTEASPPASFPTARAEALAAAAQAVSDHPAVQAPQSAMQYNLRCSNINAYDCRGSSGNTLGGALPPNFSKEWDW